VRIGGFELIDPVPELNEPYVLATLRPWIDVNNVGSLILKELERQFRAFELGRLARPGRFYDFTRYRPTIDIEGGINEMTIPNTTVHYARRRDQNDLVFLNLLEPQANADIYVDSVARLLTTLKTSKYVSWGACTI